MGLAEATATFDRACCYVRDIGFWGEVSRYQTVDFNSFSESELLKEIAWVILCSGFREALVKRVFDRISLCFLDWESTTAIRDSKSICIRSGMCFFRNHRKLKAIASCAEMISDATFESFKCAVIENPIAELQKLPYIGPITVWHLAKNLGLDVAKPDRHLNRFARSCQFRDAHDLCSAIANARKEQVRVVDLILWRYLVDHPNVSERCSRRDPSIGSVGTAI
jgi:hypothetical protein